MNRSRSSFCSKPGCTKAASDQINCSRCHKVFYCARKHQMADLKRHKAQCTNPGPPVCNRPAPPLNLPLGGGTSEPKRPINLVLFPASGIPATIITMDCFLRESPVYVGLTEDWIDLRTYIDSPSITCAAVGPARVLNKVRSRLYIAWSDTATDDDPANLCVARYADGPLDEGRSVSWRGNLIGFRQREPVRKHIEYVDVTERDVATFAAFFEKHGEHGITECPDSLIRLFYDIVDD